jgi:membrane associated rhomboid family serine protease
MPLAPVDLRRTPVTLSFAIVIAALEIVCTLDPDRRFYYYNDLKLGILSTMWRGELWRPFTTTLLHGNWIHALFNLYWLWGFGQVLEQRLGSLRFLALCVLLAYVSMLPEYMVLNYHAEPRAQTPIVGFSGVIYGLFGLLWVGRRWRPEFEAVCHDDIVRLMLGWLVLCVGLTWTRLMPVANIAHAAGLLFGILYGLAAFSPHRRLRWVCVSSLATVVVLATLVGAPGHRCYEATRELQRFEHLLNTLPLEPARKQTDGG